MTFYHQTKPWILNGDRIPVVEDNDHLWLVLSDWDEEQKNLDQNIIKCRQSLFALLGSAFSYKCKLSPVTTSHWKEVPVITAIQVKSKQFICVSFILLLTEWSVVQDRPLADKEYFVIDVNWSVNFSKYFLWDLEIGKHFLRTRFAGSRSLSSSAPPTPPTCPTINYFWRDGKHVCI